MTMAAIGLFDRQAPIGLEVPEWLKIYVSADMEPEAHWKMLEEIIEGVATMGCRGVTVVFSASNHPTRPHELELIRDRVVRYRPWFRAVACDEVFYLDNEAKLSGGDGMVVRPAGELPPLMPVPASILGKDGQCTVLDIETTMVGRASDPAGMIRGVSAMPEVEIPWALPQWGSRGRAPPSSLPGRWRAEERILASACIVLALNIVAKPQRFQGETFFFASEFLDRSVSGAVNERGLRARWQQGAAA
jgi:hypothetical protein